RVRSKTDQWQERRPPPNHERWVREPAFGLAVLERVLVERRHKAARRQHDRMAGSCIPFARLAESRIYVGVAAGYEAKLERRADVPSACDPRIGQKTVRIGCAMRSACDSNEPRWVRFARPNRGCLNIVEADRPILRRNSNLYRFVRTNCDEKLIGGRCVHQPESRRPLNNEANVHCDIRAAGHEFTRAIEHVNAEESISQARAI